MEWVPCNWIITVGMRDVCTVNVAYPDDEPFAQAVFDLIAGLKPAYCLLDSPWVRMRKQPHPWSHSQWSAWAYLPLPMVTGMPCVRKGHPTWSWGPETFTSEPVDNPAG